MTIKGTVKRIFTEKESGFNDDRPEFAKLKELTKDDIDIVALEGDGLFCM